MLWDDELIEPAMSLAAGMTAGRDGKNPDAQPQLINLRRGADIPRGRAGGPEAQTGGRKARGKLA